MIHVEIAELATNPIRTGIQRVVREIVRRMPDLGPVRFCTFDEQIGYPRLLEPGVIPLLADETKEVQSMAPCALAERIRGHIVSGDAGLVRDFATPIFVPEVFFNPVRAGYHLWRLGHAPERSYFFAHDFIPWLHPDRIGVVTAAPLMPYLQLLSSAPNVAFNSARTRSDYADRIVRRRDRLGPVIPLGADGLRSAREVFSPARKNFLCVGSIDGRKNQHLVLRAFQQLWKSGFDMTLTFAGRIFDPESKVAADIADAGREPRFTYVESPNDDDLRLLFENARATIYVSEFEGFGLPPVESLKVGVPTIVSSHLPSTENLSDRGIVKLDRIDEREIAAAVVMISEDRAAAELWQGAAELKLPTWADAAASMNKWVRQ